MPLIKHIKVDPMLSGYDYRRREELLRGDFIRHVSNGTCSSIRTLELVKNSKPSMVIFNTLKSLAEDEVEVGDEAFAAYMQAQDLLANQMSRLFEKTRNVGAVPKKACVTPFIGTDYKQSHVFYVNETWAWFPKTAVMMGAEIVILFRVCSVSETEMNEANSFALGIAMKDLDFVFPELDEYVTFLKNKASKDEAVAHAFRYLMQLICPRETAAQEIRERAERYKDVRNFGTWG